MYIDVHQAFELYNQAHLAEQEGKLNLAEVYYLKSWTLFKEAGNTHIADAANVLNTLGLMRQELGDHKGALTAAEEAARMLESITEVESSRDVREIRLQVWGLIGNVYRHLAKYAEAEQVLIRALNYAIEHFGEADEETSAARNHLGILYKYTG